MTIPTTNSRLPAGAVDVGPWHRDRGRVRGFRGTKRVVDTADGPDAHLVIVGDQHVDGYIWRRILVGDLVLAATEARQVARMLIAASDEIDWLSDSDWSAAGLSDPTAIIEP